MNNVLDRHQSFFLLQSVEGWGCPQGRLPWQLLSEQLGPAPGTLNSGRVSSQGWVTLESLFFPPLSFQAAASQGIRHVSELPCCLIYVHAGLGRRCQSGVKADPGGGGKVGCWTLPSPQGPLKGSLVFVSTLFSSRWETLWAPQSRERRIRENVFSTLALALFCVSHCEILAIKGMELCLSSHWASPKRAFRKISRLLLRDTGCGLFGQRENE